MHISPPSHPLPLNMSIIEFLDNIYPHHMPCAANDKSGENESALRWIILQNQYDMGSFPQLDGLDTLSKG